MPWGIFILSRRLSVLLRACLLLGGLFWSVASGAQVIAQGGTLEVMIPDGGGEVQLVPLAGGPAKTCTQAGGTDCRIIGTAGDDIELTAVPHAGWGFLEWWVNGSPGTAASPLVEPLPFGGVTTVDAYFGPILTVSVNGPGGGTVSSDDGAIVCVAGQVCSHTYSRSYTSPIQLTAIADSGSVFAGWNQPGGGNACANPTANVCELTAYGTGFGALPNGVTALFELVDDDGDGVGNTADQCPNTPTGELVDAEGCPVSGNAINLEDLEQVFENLAGQFSDQDDDGVSDADDQCPETAAGETVDELGCSASQIDTDGDGVADSDDQCPATPQDEEVGADGCPVQIEEEVEDTDVDGVPDELDSCPDTPLDEAVDNEGCSDSQRDNDGDTVFNDADQCPDTLANAEVDAVGCSADQKDSDQDGVNDAADNCPATPTGLAVDEEGCSESQKDSDTDGVNDAADICPATPTGLAVDEEGCADSQKDSDQDGVADDKDSCPNTPDESSSEVNGDGCAPAERDSDLDGESDDVDLCPATPAGQKVDVTGCALSQLDSDADGVTDDRDQCPNSTGQQSILQSGCTQAEEDLANLGDDLSSLDGLSSSEKDVASAIDVLCPLLIIADSQGQLTAEQKDLRDACANLKNKDSTKEQQTGALAAITPEQVSNRTDIALDTGATQMRQISQRLLRVRSGNARGISLSGLTLKFDDQAVPGTVLDQAVDAVTDEQSAFQDFGRWGVFVQGDVNVLDRDSTDSRASYESDSWLVTTGADYRFDNDWYLGVAVNYGETDSDYRDATSNIETVGLSLYGGWVFSEKGFIDFLLGYLDDDYELTRRVAYTDSAGAFNANYSASTGGTQMTGGVNFGWMWNQGGWRFGPTASISFIDGKVNGYREAAVGADSAAWALSVEETAYSQWSLRLGAQLDYAWLTDIGVIIPGIIANYVAETARESDDTSARFAHDLANFGEAFTINRDFRDARYYDVTFNLAGQFSYGISAYGSYRVTGGRSGVTHSGYTLGLRWDQAF